jgi:hypothetical protein
MIFLMPARPRRGAQLLTCANVNEMFLKSKPRRLRHTGGIGIDCLKKVLDFLLNVNRRGHR